MIFNTNNNTAPLLAEGGEGFIYDLNDHVIKIYKPHIDRKSKHNKIRLLMQKQLPPSAIKPLDVVENNKGEFIGIKMKKVIGEDFKRLSNKKYVKTNNVNTKDVLLLLEELWGILKELHNNNIYIGDLNDQNVLFDLKTHKIFLIDCDSWSVETFKCEVAMDLFKDPLLVGNDFNAKTDIYAFCILAWKSLTRLHPFGGTLNPDIPITERMVKGISVIDNNKVKLPRTTKPWKSLSPDMVTGFKQVFEAQDRVFGNYIKDLLGNLSFCNTDKDYFYNGYTTCPICNAASFVAKKAVLESIEDGFKVAKELQESDVKIVYSSTVYLNTKDEVVDIPTGRRVPYTCGRYLFTSMGDVIICHEEYIAVHYQGSKGYQIPIQRGSYPLIDNNKIYYISNNNQLKYFEIFSDGMGHRTVEKCSQREFFNVKNDHYCLVNIYDGKVIVNIDKYNSIIDFKQEISDVGIRYDCVYNRWAVVIEDKNNTYYTYIFEQGKQLWYSDKIPYKCSVYNICFDHGVIYIPIDNAIRGLNYQTMKYKDFSCSVVDTSSELVKDKSQFIIVNDDNIYKFYK